MQSRPWNCADFCNDFLICSKWCANSLDLKFTKNGLLSDECFNFAQLNFAREGTTLLVRHNPCLCYYFRAPNQARRASANQSDLAYKLLTAFFTLIKNMHFGQHIGLSSLSDKTFDFLWSRRSPFCLARCGCRLPLLCLDGFLFALQAILGKQTFSFFYTFSYISVSCFLQHTFLCLARCGCRLFISFRSDDP